MDERLNTRKIEQLEQDVRGIKNELGRAPLRIEPPLISEGEDEIHDAFCKTNAGAATTIQCYLDEDFESDPDAWVISTLYEAGDYVTGSDDKVYRCKIQHTSGDESPTDDQPITGADWEDFWELIEITVHCNVFAADYLQDCIPELLDGKKIQVAKNEADEWWCISDIFNGYVECAES